VALVGAAERASVGIIVAVRSGDGYVSDFANDRMKDLLGRAPQAVPGDLALDAAALAKVEAWFAQATTAPLLVDAAVVNAGARSTPVRIVGSRSAVLGRAGVVLFFYDAAWEGHAQRALEEAEARFRRLLDAAPGAIALGTRERFIYANPAAVRLLGYSTMEEVTSIPLRQHVHTDDRSLARQIVAALLSSDAAPVTRVRMIHREGREVVVDLQTMQIEFGGEKALLGVAHDLSERRRVQAQLVRADRLSAVGTLAAGVAHEINNPLAYLMLNLQYVMRELPRFDGDKTRLEGLLERLAEAEHGARRVSTIVGDLRTLARPEQTKHEPVAVTKALSAAIKVAGVELRRRARVVEVYERVPYVDASPTRLEQVFVNLLVNAGHAIKEGRPDDNEIRVIAKGEGDRVVVEVRDTGAGIAPEVLGRVFDPFFTTKPRGLGTGLGLPISRGIVKSLGGEITVTSAVGVGTTFRVTLPALSDDDARLLHPPEEPLPSTAGLAAEPPAASKRARARVLVVDDEPLVADMLRRTLSDGHDVTVATDARTALDFVLSGAEFDVIFCDLLMPRMSGMDLYTALRAERPGVEERIVFMTGGAFTERAAQFLATVPNRKMSKPFDLTELERVVSKAARPVQP
jgi:PAS domain S-box-containing protein